MELCDNVPSHQVGHCYSNRKINFINQNAAYSQKRNYFDYPNCFGIINKGIIEQTNSGCAVVMSNGEEGFKFMKMGKQHEEKPFPIFSKLTSKLSNKQIGLGRMLL